MSFIVEAACKRRHSVTIYTVLSRYKSILAVDIGNTNASVAVFRNCSADIRRWEAAARANFALAETGSLPAVLRAHGPVCGAVIGSVAGEKVTEKTAAAVESATGSRPLLAGCSMQTGLTIRYKTPETLGIDRLANAAALFALCGGACVAVDLGTATTFDCVSENGAYLGGAIAPGLGSFTSALPAAAPALPATEPEFPPSVLAQTTVDCVKSGTMFGYARMVDGMVGSLLEEMDAPRARVVATGGFASAVCGRCRTVAETDDLLTLKGLAIILVKNEGLLSV